MHGGRGIELRRRARVAIALPPDRPRTEADAVQIRLLRAAGPSTRLAVALSLSAAVRDLAVRAIRERHPDWPEQEVLLQFAEIHYGPELARKIRDYLESQQT